MDTKALRQKILDLAIRGKLVPQDPNDEPAEVLLERIREQKQQMLKEGKLKKKDIKNDTIIFKGEDNLHYEKFQDGTVKCIEDEIPFEVPEGWVWERLSNLASFSGGKTPSTSHSEYWDGDILWVTSKDMKSKYITSSQLCLSALGAEQMRIHQPNTLLLVIRSGILRHTLPVAILKESATINQDLKAIVLYMPQLAEYIYVCLKGMEARLLLKYTKSGTTVENVNFDDFQKALLPIPPAQQIDRIISSTGDAECIVSTVEDNKVALADCVAKAKAKILDLAIHGKLVPQDPNDEPASVLLERIRAEKEELIKQGKIKRDKKESVIFKGDDNSYYLRTELETMEIADELPYEIPESWEWARIGNVFQVNPRNKLDDLLEVSFIPMPLIDDGFSGKHTSEVRVWKKIKSGFTHFTEGDIGIAKITPCFENRKSVVFRNLKNNYGAGTTELHVLRPYASSILPEYVLAYVKSSMFIDKGKQEFTGAVGQQRIGKDYVENSYFPIPPLAEQKRIVEQISTVYKQLDLISNALR